MSASNSKQAQARELKHRVLTCLHKLADRDTHSAAASELESIAKTLHADSLPSFLSSISATDSSAKSPVRRQCLRLVSVLSENHGNSLSPHLSKLLSTIVRHLRDPNSAVRSACVAASLSLSSHLTNPPFTSIAKPFVEYLFTEQDVNAQNGAALCLSAIIEGSRNLDIGSLRRLVPRFQKLVKRDNFRAKPALLALLGSVIGVNGVFSNCAKNVIQNLITCLVEFLNSDDWAARKATAEALMKVAGLEKEALVEYKASCLGTFESKRFDKVKAAREAMNLMIEAWKEIPDQSDEVSQSPELQASSKENASDDRYPPISKTSIGSSAPQVRRRISLDNPPGKTPVSNNSPLSTARKRNSVVSNENKSGPAIFRKLDLKKPLSNCNAEIAVPPRVSSGMLVSEANSMNNGGNNLRIREEVKQKPEVKLDICRNQRECEDLSLIRKQLVQIENQQSHLLDLLQKFIGTSQNGMHSLEARVHGLELALDEISFDSAVSTGRMSQNGAARTMCCNLPGAKFLTSKLWRKTGHSSTSRLPISSGGPSASAAPRINGNGDARGMEDRRYQLRGGHGLVLNPLAKIYRGSREISEVSSDRIVVNNATI